MMPVIIAIGGKARSGKTTAATFLAAKLSGNCAIESFATPLKEMVLAQFGDQVSAADLIHNKSKILTFGDRQMTLRRLMIAVGDMYRAIDEDFWIKKLLATLPAHEADGCSHVIIDDMRMPREFDVLERLGAALYRVERPDVEQIADNTETALDCHTFDTIFHNERSLEDFYGALDEHVQRVRTGIAR